MRSDVCDRSFPMKLHSFYLTYESVIVRAVYLLV